VKSPTSPYSYCVLLHKQTCVCASNVYEYVIKQTQKTQSNYQSRHFFMSVYNALTV